MLGSPSAGRRLTCAGTGSRGGHIAATRGNTAKLCCTSCDTRVVTTCWFSGTFFVSDGRQKIVNEGSRIPGRLLLNKQVDGCPDIGFMILIDSSWPSLCSVWSSIFLAELWPLQRLNFGRRSLLLGILGSYFNTLTQHQATCTQTQGKSRILMFS